MSVRENLTVSAKAYLEIAQPLAGLLPQHRELVDAIETSNLVIQKRSISIGL